jgi:hypothetical protein
MVHPDQVKSRNRGFVTPTIDDDFLYLIENLRRIGTYDLRRVNQRRSENDRTLGFPVGIHLDDGRILSSQASRSEQDQRGEDSENQAS